MKNLKLVVSLLSAVVLALVFGASSVSAQKISNGVYFNENGHVPEYDDINIYEVGNYGFSNGDRIIVFSNASSADAKKWRDIGSSGRYLAAPVNTSGYNLEKGEWIQGQDNVPTKWLSLVQYNVDGKKVYVDPARGDLNSKWKTREAESFAKELEKKSKLTPKQESKPKPKQESKPKPKQESKPKPKQESKPKPKQESKPKPKQSTKSQSSQKAKSSQSQKSSTSSKSKEKQKIQVTSSEKKQEKTSNKDKENKKESLKERDKSDKEKKDDKKDKKESIDLKSNDSKERKDQEGKEKGLDQKVKSEVDKTSVSKDNSKAKAIVISLVSLLVGFIIVSIVIRLRSKNA